MENIDSEIVGLVAKIIRKRPEDIDVKADLFLDYKVDSLLGVEILAGLDKKYGIDIPENKLREMRTTADIIRVTKELVSKKR